MQSLGWCEEISQSMGGCDWLAVRAALAVATGWLWELLWRGGDWLGRVVVLWLGSGCCGSVDLGGEGC